MDVRKLLALRGPNVWAEGYLLEIWLDLGWLHSLTLSELPTLGERLPTHAHVFEHVLRTLLCRAGTEVGFSRTVETAEPGVYRVACAYEDEDVGRAAVAAACELCMAAAAGRPFDLEAEAAKLRELADRLRPSPLTDAVTRAARCRGVPVRPLGDGLLMLGHGSRQQRVLGARTSRTGALAEAISRDADLTRGLLRAVGLPAADGPPAWRALVVGGRVITDAPADLAARAVEAAQVVGLDVAGVTLGPDGAVAAVEADPAVGPDTAAAVGEAIVAELFGEGEDGRVPVVAVTGVNGKTTTTRLIAHILTQARHRVGFTCTEGIIVGGQLIEAGDCSGPRSAQTVLQHPDVDAAVLETARGGILRAGLGFDRCDVGVVTNIGDGDHLGSGGIDTVEQLARVKRVIVEAVHPSGAAVLKADDPLVAPMAAHCKGSVIFFARDGGHPVIASHRASGGRVAFVRGGQVILAEGDQETEVKALAQVPLTGGGRIGFQVENVLAAVAAAWSLGVQLRTIRAALRSFGSGVEQSPARFNLLEVNGAVAVLDYGHNTSSLAAILDTLSQFPATARTAVYSAAGDRRDCDLIRQGEMLGDGFDRVILYEDENCTRGRQPGEIIRLIRRGLEGRQWGCEVLEVIGAVRAVDRALSMARTGELLLIQVDVVDATLELVHRYLSTTAAREVSMEEGLAMLARSRGEVPLELAEASAPGQGRRDWAGLPLGHDA